MPENRGASVQSNQADNRMKTTRIRATKLSLNRSNLRQVLEGASPLALIRQWRANQKRQRTAAVQDASAPKPLCVIPQPSRHVVFLFNVVAAITGCLLMLCPVSARAQGGVPLWTNAPGGTAIAVDDKGNALVTGGDATIKYSSAGLPLWTNLFGGRAIALDSTGDVFVSGGGTIKISSAGTSVWTNNSAGYAIVMDNSGDIYVTSSSFSEGSDYETTKISSTGVAVWTNRYDGGGRDYAQAIAVDGSGNVFVTGYSESRGSAFTHDYLTIAYSPAGELLWLDSYTGITADGDNYANAIATDSSGNVFVTGASTAAGGRDD